MVEFTEVVPQGSPARQETILGFFAERGLESVRDYLAGEGTMRIFSFRLPSSADEVARICRAAMVELHGISQEEPLLVTLEENP